jgi:hypothetical protein
VDHVWLFNLSNATTGPRKANADIQCACITSSSSIYPKPRLDLTRPTRTFSGRVSRLTLHSVQDNGRPLKVNANIQCVCAIQHRQRQPHSSFCPGQRQTSQGQREHSLRVRDITSTETTALFILSKTATGLSGSTRTFPCVRPTLQQHHITED